MSFPAAAWRIRGGLNFRSRQKPATNPRKSALEWLALADALTDAGGEVVAMPPAEVDPPLTGMMYTANAGAFFGDVFAVSRMHVAHRLDEAAPIEVFMKELGLGTVRWEPTWEGQAEICTLPGSRYILTWGVRSDEESCALSEGKLPAGAHTLKLKICDPFIHGDTCMASLPTPGRHLLLVHEAALVDRSLDDLARFAGGVEVVSVSEADALAYACNALSVGGKWLCPTGISEKLKRTVAAQGLEIVELDLGELFGKGGGGPRCLVNELDVLATLPEVPPALGWQARRPGIVQAIDAYPETA